MYVVRNYLTSCDALEKVLPALDSLEGSTGSYQSKTQLADTYNLLEIDNPPLLLTPLFFLQRYVVQVWFFRQVC